MAFTYRTIKGSELTWAELDENFRLVDQYHDESASSAAIAAASANFKGNWGSLTGPLTKPASVKHNNQYWLLLNNLADVTASQPGVSSDWTVINTGDVVGPGSSTTNALVRWNNTTGKSVKDSTATLADNGSLSLKTSATTANAMTVTDATYYTLQAGYVSSGIGHFGGATGTAVHLRANGQPVLVLTIDGRVLSVSGGIGYGTGAGGTVTQATSKSTAVTLNKPCGVITMHNAALAAGASVLFTLNNSLISAVDTVVAAIGSASDSYVVNVNYTNNGLCILRVTNISGGSLSQALTINFAVLKGATS